MMQVQHKLSLSEGRRVFKQQQQRRQQAEQQQQSISSVAAAAVTVLAGRAVHGPEMMSRHLRRSYDTFRTWIESKCKYSTQWGACNVSSSARLASDRVPRRDMPPYLPPSRLCSLLFLSPSPPFFASAEKKPVAETSGRVVPTPCENLSSEAPLQHMHQPAACARCRDGLVIVREAPALPAVRSLLCNSTHCLLMFDNARFLLCHGT